MKQKSIPPSAFVLLASNLVVMILALTQKWSVGTVLWVYWWQSLILGISAFAKMVFAEKHASAEKVGVKNYLLWMEKQGLIVFFVITYIVLHFIYAAFITQVFGAQEGILLQHVALGVAIFLANHLFSFIFNFLKKEKSDFSPEKAQQLVLETYERIIPMQLTIIFGAYVLRNINGSNTAIIILIIFLILKSFIDFLFHIQAHQLVESMKSTKQNF